MTRATISSAQFLAKIMIALMIIILPRFQSCAPYSSYIERIRKCEFEIGEIEMYKKCRLCLFCTFANKNISITGL